MESLALDEVPLDGEGFGSKFPFEFAGQPGAGPSGVSVGFEIADVTDGFGIVNRPEAREGVIQPLAILLDPVERGRPLFLLDRSPSHGEPQVGARVAAVLNELVVFAVRDEARSEAEGFEEGAVAGRFIIEGEAGAFV